MKLSILGEAEPLSRPCPRATQDIGLNLANRQKAIQVAMYGPANPSLDNKAYWLKLANVWGVSPTEAQTMRCGNCAAFDVSTPIRDCIRDGLGGQPDTEQVIAAGDLGYCWAFRFKCASRRTCSAWVVGGPITDTNPRRRK